MALHQGESFTDVTVELDGNTFIRCTIQRCRLIYRGGDLPVLNNNSIGNSTFDFEDAALRTLQFLGFLRAGGGRDVVDGILDQIRRGPSGAAGTH